MPWNSPGCPFAAAKPVLALDAMPHFTHHVRILPRRITVPPKHSGNAGSTANKRPQTNSSSRSSKKESLRESTRDSTRESTRDSSREFSRGKPTDHSGAARKSQAPVLMGGLPMARMVDQTPVLAPDQTHGPIHGRARGLALARIRAEKPVRRVPRCAGPSLLQNQNHRKVCASIRPLLPRAIARVAMLTSLFLQVACVLTASRNQTPHGACCHLKAFLSMGAFCRPRRLLPILCSTSPCRW